MFRLSTFLLLAPLAFASMALHAQCPTKPLSEDLLTEDGIRKYLDLFGQQKLGIEDFGCCLPSIFQKSYVVVHSSIAAQDSIPSSPRVIMTNFEFNDSGLSRPPTAFFSVNGGHHSLRQTASYELALVDPQNGTLKLYDLDFSNGKPTMHGPNPPKCISCHGNNGQISGNGPHLIFDGPDVWPRFVNGLDFLDPLDSRPTPPWLRKYLTRLNTASKTSLKTNPRFKCLSPKLPTVGFQNELDHMINRLNQIRVANEVVQTRDYDKYKFAIAGSVTCPELIHDIDCQIKEMEAASLAGLPTEGSKCKLWFSRESMREFSDTSTLNGWVNQAKNKAELDALSLTRFNDRRREIQKEAETSNETGALERMNFDFRPRILADRKSVLPEKLNTLESMLLRRFAIDTELHGGALLPATRFLFEARRIPIASWSTDVVGGYQRQSIGIFELLKKEPAGGALRAAMNRPGNICENLRAASLAATSASPPSETSTYRHSPTVR